MDNTTYEMRLAQWTKLIQECNASGLQKLDWCQQNGINKNAFYYWQRKIRNHVFEAQEKSDPAQLTTTGAAFVEVPTTLAITTPKPSKTAATIHISGWTIEIDESASDSLIRNLIGSLAYVK